VRVQAAHDREHVWYTSFTLYRGCTSLPTSHVTHLPRDRDFPFISIEDTRQGSTTRPLQSSTSFRKPATVFRKLQCRDPSVDRHRGKINPRTSLHWPLPYFLAPFGYGSHPLAFLISQPRMSHTTLAVALFPKWSLHVPINIMILSWTINNKLIIKVW
jgi:hypothetical protein